MTLCFLVRRQPAWVLAMPCRAGHLRPPCASRRTIASTLLRRGWFKPWPAGAYLIKARKRVYTLTPLRPKLQRTQAIGGLVKPTTPRQSS